MAGTITRTTRPAGTVGRYDASGWQEWRRAESWSDPRPALVFAADAFAAVATAALAGGTAVGLTVFLVAALGLDLFDRHSVHLFNRSALDDAPMLAIRAIEGYFEYPRGYTESYLQRHTASAGRDRQGDGRLRRAAVMV